VSKLWRTLAISAAASAVVATGAVPALAQPAQSPTLTISAHSSFPKEYGYTFVPFHDGHYSTVTISGAVSGATSGTVAQLFAQQFPYKSAPAPVTGQQLALDGTSPQDYSFTASPGLATRYSVEVLPSSTVSTPVQATSATSTVYVVTNQTLSRLKKCGRPVCHLTLHIYTRVPGPAYKAESKKKLYFYSGLKFSRSGEVPPSWLYLDRSAKISKPKRISATEFEQSLSVSFRVGENGFYWLPDFCSKASESSDGVNLPGHHHCGASKVRPSWFLG
jgi:hypothetical protein